MYSPRIRSTPISEQTRTTSVPIKKRCGSGMFGDVYESDTGLALKIVVHGRGHQEAARCLAREANALQRCNQLGVLHVIRFVDYSHGWHETTDSQGELLEIHKTQGEMPQIDPSAPCDVMAIQMADSGSLQELLERGSLLNERQIKKVATQILEALIGLHERAHIVHRDIKPANILIHQKEIKLIDFGLCSDRGDPKTPCGTPYYMAPEVLRSNFRPYTSKVDLWSLGVLLYRCSVGRLPFAGINTHEIYRSVQEYLSGRSTLYFPQDFNPEIADFISYLLTPEQARPDARTALNHPWLLL